MQNLFDFMQNFLFSTMPKSRNITREMSALGIENAYICIHTQSESCVISLAGKFLFQNMHVVQLQI